VKLCTTEVDKTLNEIPPGIHENCYFIVKNDEGSEGSQSYADGSGAWNARTRRHRYWLIQQDGEETKIQNLKKEANEDGQEIYVYHSRKKQVYNVNHQDTILSVFMYQTVMDGYNRKVSTLHFEAGKEMQVHGVSVWEYCGKHPGHKTHGNSTKDTRPYIRTRTGVLKVIQEDVNAAEPHQVYRKMVLENDKEVDKPRDLKQVQNIKYLSNRLKHGNMADQCLQILQEHDTDSFVRRIFPQKDNSYAFVCGTNESITRMMQHCSVDKRRIIGIDRTFNLSNYYVTVVVYQHQNLLVRSTNVHPPIVGALLIHTKGNTESYYDLMSTLKFELSKLTKESPNFDLSWGDVTFGSDDEAALRKAITLCFPGSVMTRCTKHDKDTIRRYLKDKVGVDDKTRESVVHSMFKGDGILGAKSEHEFEENKQNLEDEMKEKLGPKYEKFRKCFERMCSALKEHVLTPSLKHGIATDWTNNQSESTNHRIRKFQNFEVVSLQELKANLQSLVMYQDVEIARATYDAGTYKLTDVCAKKYGKKTVEEWKNLSVISQKKRTKSINCFIEDVAVEKVLSSDGTFIVGNQNTKKKPGKSAARSEQTTSKKK
jgi:hypothetical protein